MDLISVESLKTFSEYYDKRIKVKIIHFCPLDGRETDPKCKRIVVTSDVSQTQQPIDRYLVVVLYGSYAKTPFKKSSIRIGQILTLQRFETNIMPINKIFKCNNGLVIKDFYEPLVLVKPEFKPIIKMIVSVREDISDNCFIPIQDNGLNDENTCDSQSSDETIVLDNEKSPQIKESKQESVGKSVKTPPKKRLKFDDSSSDDTSDQEIINSSKRCLRSSSQEDKNRVFNQITDKYMKSNKTIIIEKHFSPKKSDNNNSFQSLTTSTNSANNSLQISKRHEYKTLIEVHKLMPVSGRTYVHIYGVLKYRDFNNKTICLRDENAYTFTIHLKGGNSNSNRNYPGFRSGDLIRIHRLLLAPNSMDMICTDPKDIVVFEAFQDSESFTPIKTSLNPSFEDYDKRRKKELDEWFAEELLSKPLSEMNATEGYHDIVLQVIEVNTYQNRSILQVWDTTKPSFETSRPYMSNSAKPLDNTTEELLRIINENQMSVYVTVFDEHSIDVMNLKPLDFIVIFNLSIKTDKRNSSFHTLTLNSGYKFGKCIRYVKPNSYLGKKFKAKIEDFKVMSAINTVNDNIGFDEEIDFPSQSQPIYSQTNDEIEREIANSAEEEAINFSELGQDFDFEHFDDVIDVIDREESYLPSVIIVNIPPKSILIDELLTKGVENTLYSVHARAMSYWPSNDMKDVISVVCKNQECQRFVTLKQAIAEDPLIETLISSSKESKIVLNCFECKQSSGILVFKLDLILEDTRHDKVSAQLFGHNAELFLKGTPEDMIQYPNRWYFVERVLSYICAKISSLDSHNSNNKILNWVIQPSKVNDQNEFFYQIRTATAIEKADKCVGFNSS